MTSMGKREVTAQSTARKDSGAGGGGAEGLRGTGRLLKGLLRGLSQQGLGEGLELNLNKNKDMGT